MRTIVVFAVLCLIFVASLRVSDARRGNNDQNKARLSKGKSSKVKNKQKKDECYIKQDGETQLYVVVCGDETKSKPTRRPKKCKCERGKRGPRGNRGRQGSRGRPGKQGSNGPPGNDGRDGRPGIPGPKGPAGAAGLPGPPGLKGAQGDRGLQGLPGKNGKQGLPGSTGPPGNCIKKSNVGQVASPQFYCLPGKKGIKGIKGNVGNLGPVGPTGPSGKDGKKGERGDNGPRGRIGRPGPPGDFNNFYCSPRYTSWIDVNRWETNHPDVYCDTKEFLQGFRIEKNNYRKRYRYICCKLTKKG